MYYVFQMITCVNDRCSWMTQFSIMILFPIEGHSVFSPDPECHVDPGLSGNRPIRSSSWLLIKRLDSHPEWVSVCGFEWVLLVCDRKSKQDMALIFAVQLHEHTTYWQSIDNFNISC